MYKTVKQGENCLQYTILPQTEEVISNSGLKGKGRDYSPTVHIRKIKGRRTVKLTLAISMVIALIFIVSGIPVYVIVRSFFSDTTDQIFFYGKHIRMGSSTTPLPAILQKSHKRILIDGPYDPMFNQAKPEKSTVISPVTEATTTIDTTPRSVKTSEADVPFKTKKPWLMPALKRLLSTSPEAPTSQDYDPPITFSYEKSSVSFARQRESNNDLMLDRLHYSHWTESEEVIVKPTIKLTPFEDRILQDKPQEHAESVTSSAEHEDVLITHADKTTVPSKADDSTRTMKMEIGENKFKEIKDDILDDDYSYYKDPLVDEDDVSGSDDVKVSQTKATWLQNKWPFVDPSSYFQWTGYTAGDNLLLPAILSAALSALLVLGVMCYALRRRQILARRAQDIGKLTSDLQADDNTTLLTAENNMSEDE